MSSLHLLVAVLPHVGGVETPTNFVEPSDVGNVVDQSFTVTWDDMDNDPTGIFDFYYLPTNNSPAKYVPSEFGGTHIHNAMAMDATDQFTWDTSDVPSGSYYIYGVTTDPPLPQIFVFSRGTITVRHPGDPLFPSVWVPQPDGFMDIVADSYPLVWRASGVGPMTAKIEYADLNVPDDPLKLVADDIPMTQAADGTFDGAYEWDLTPFDTGSFFVRVTVTDGAGRTHAAYSKSTLMIYRPAATDGGDITFPDAGPTDDPPEEGCCSIAGRKPSTPWLFLLLAAAVVISRRFAAR